MDATEIARLREIATGADRGEIAVPAVTVAALLAALEQAQKEIALFGGQSDMHQDNFVACVVERDAAQRAYKAECDEHKRTVDEACAEEDKLVAERDAAQKDAKDARALLRSWVDGEWDGQFGSSGFVDAARKLLGMPVIEWES